MAIRVNTAVKAVKAPIAHPVRNPACRRMPAFDQLLARDYSPLPPGKLAQAG